MTKLGEWQLTKEYVFGCLLSGAPIEMVQSDENLTREFALLKEMGVIRRMANGDGATVTHDLKVFVQDKDGSYTLFSRLRKGHFLPAVRKVE